MKFIAASLLALLAAPPSTTLFVQSKGVGGDSHLYNKKKVSNHYKKHRNRKLGKLGNLGMHGGIAAKSHRRSPKQMSVPSSSCSETKEVAIDFFCNLGNNDLGNDFLFLQDGSLDRENYFEEEDSCYYSSLTAGQEIVEASQSLSFGIGTDKIELLGTEWYSETCEEYFIAVMMKLDGEMLACWDDMLGGVTGPNNLDIPPCWSEPWIADESELENGSFAFGIYVSPESIDPATVDGMVDWPADWTDSDGDGCDFYNRNPGFCGPTAILFENDGYTANEACAICGGGISSDEEPPSDGGSGSNGSGSNGVPGSINNPGYIDWPTGWTDIDGDDCGFYAANPDFCGSMALWFENDGYTANTACVACGGGIPSGDEPPSDVGSGSDAIDNSEGRVDFPLGWTDAYGDGCEWYAVHSGRCTDMGDAFPNEGYTANEACVVCGGGVVPASDEQQDPTDAPNSNPAGDILAEGGYPVGTEVEFWEDHIWHNGVVVQFENGLYTIQWDESGDLDQVQAGWMMDQMVHGDGIN